MFFAKGFVLFALFISFYDHWNVLAARGGSNQRQDGRHAARSNHRGGASLHHQSQGRQHEQGQPLFNGNGATGKRNIHSDRPNQLQRGNKGSTQHVANAANAAGHKHSKRTHVRTKAAHPMKFSMDQVHLFAKRMDTDKRFSFMKSTAIPKVDFSHVKSVQQLIDHRELPQAGAIAADLFATYRIHVLEYIYSLKQSALKVCDEEESAADGLVLATVVFKIFNVALNHLEIFHEATIRQITLLTERSLRTNQRNRKVNPTPIIKEMRRRLRLYEGKVRKAHTAIRLSLSLIYALEKKGVSAVEISQRVNTSKPN